jgi:hypothetical protein
METCFVTSRFLATAIIEQYDYRKMSSYVNQRRKFKQKGHTVPNDIGCFNRTVSVTGDACIALNGTAT